jgi:16S rRNA processing protein RimM
MAQSRPDQAASPWESIAPIRTEQSVPDDLIELGRVGEPYGIKGWINVLNHNSDSAALKSAKVWFLHWSAVRLTPAQAAPEVPKASPRLVPVRVAQTKLHSGRLIAQLVGMDDRNLAEHLKGAQVWVSRSQFPPLKKGEFYWVDLIGLAVVNREGVHLGTVSEVVDHGAHPILCLPATGQASGDEGTDDQERLIPFVPAYIDGVDLVARRITVDWQADY